MVIEMAGERILSTGSLTAARGVVLQSSSYSLPALADRPDRVYAVDLSQYQAHLVQGIGQAR
jgi:hypothetical protein